MNSFFIQENAGQDLIYRAREVYSVSQKSSTYGQAGPSTVAHGVLMGPDQEGMVNTVNGRVDKKVHTQSASKNSVQDVPMRQEIPKLPTNVKDLVELWTMRSTERGFRPIRLYEFAGSRKKIIMNYSDKKWRSSGQKRAFYRFKILSQEIVACSSEIDAITENVTKGELERAIQDFEKNWSKNDKSITLSLVEKDIGKKIQ